MTSPATLAYSPDLLTYTRRATREVWVGNVGLGGHHPIRVQSMITSDTRDTAACVAEILELAEAGCEIVRLTAQTRVYAANLEHIARAVRAAGCQVPLVADIHFKPDAALEAAKWVEKIRVNPGNYADKKKFEIREYSNAQYEEEIERIREEFSPLGMVESALEFARIAREHNYHELVFSMKASNPKVMIEAYRLLVARLAAEGPDWNYPIHLGVTEAGDGEDGRIKSAIGIGSLLDDGIGDTIRVSLTEDSVHELPVARELVSICGRRSPHAAPGAAFTPSYDPFTYERRSSEAVTVMGHALGGGNTVRVATTQERWNAVVPKFAALGEFKPELILEKSEVVELDPCDDAAVAALNAEARPRLVTVADGTAMAVVPAFRLLAARLDPRHPILLKDALGTGDRETRTLTAMLAAATRIGALLCDGIGDAVLVRGEPGAEASLRLAYNILQAAGSRLFKTDYVACPSCGRTLFNLQQTTQKIRAATGHLKGVRIAVMGCIVNGPGEMADADFGYVGGAPGKINLYVGKTPVQFNLPEDEAVARLIELIRAHGKWAEPAEIG